VGLWDCGTVGGLGQLPSIVNHPTVPPWADEMPEIWEI